MDLGEPVPSVASTAEEIIAPLIAELSPIPTPAVEEIKTEADQKTEPEQKQKEPEDELVADICGYAKDPYGFVLYSFAWGSGDLKDHPGPDEWQTDILKAIRDGLLTVDQAIQIAIASGHGIGKSALIAWLILWGLATRENSRGIVTANTESQLKTKTWPELAKWHRAFIAVHWFEYTATSLYSKEAGHEKTWRVDMIAWSENNTEAFAGLHNQGGRVMLFFDEASAIPDKIWEVAEGAMTDKDTEIFWIAFGNPTRNQGRFFDCFNALRHRWVSKQIDSRACRMSNKEQIKKWADDYGEDSDWFKVRVRGEFPNASEHQFIPQDIVTAARGKHLKESQFSFAPKILCLDNAWTGGDEIVIGMRQGLASKICATFRKNDDDMVIAGHLARIEDEEHADAVFIDLGHGTGVYSAGKQLGRTWILIPFGGGSPDPGFVNMRAFMWGELKKWLRSGGALPNDPVLCAEIVGPEAYTVATGPNAGKLYLESKDDMRARGVTSPNRADQLALSFAQPVMSKSQRTHLEFANTAKVYDPFDSNGYRPV